MVVDFSESILTTCLRHTDYDSIPQRFSLLIYHSQWMLE
jgi:hypothetical protein